MGKKIAIITISFISAFIIISSGYGLWQDELTIKGSIEIRQDPKVNQTLEVVLQEIKLHEEQKELEEQKLNVDSNSEEQIIDNKSEQVDETIEGVIEEAITEVSDTSESLHYEEDKSGEFILSTSTEDKEIDDNSAGDSEIILDAQNEGDNNDI